MRRNLVLVVDDSPDDVGFIRRALDRANVRVDLRTAANGQLALDWLEGDPDHRPPRVPKLIIIDLKMPLVNGFDVLKGVRKVERMAGVPVFVFTSSSEPSDVERCRGLGAAAYVRKPDILEDFREAVVEMIRYGLSIEPGARPLPRWESPLNVL